MNTIKMAAPMSQEDALIIVKRFVTQEDQSSVVSYEEHASHYEQVLSTLDYSGASKAAVYAHSVLKGKFDSKIIDVAAGSGLAGIELQKLGYTNLDGIDACEGLLKDAEKRGIYKSIMCQFFGPENPMPVDDGGYIVNVFREEAIRVPSYKGDFDAFHDRLEAAGRWKKVLREEFPEFLYGVLGLCQIYQVL